MYLLIFALIAVVVAAIVLAVFPSFDPQLKRYFIILIGVIVLVCLLVFLWQFIGGSLPADRAFRIR